MPMETTNWMTLYQLLFCSPTIQIICRSIIDVCSLCLGKVSLTCAVPVDDLIVLTFSPLILSGQCKVLVAPTHHHKLVVHQVRGEERGGQVN